MDKLESRLKRNNDWEYQLYLLIKKILTANTKNYKFGKGKLDENLEHIFLNAWDVIEGNKQKYLIVNNNKRPDKNERDYNIRILLNPNYMLNKDEVIPYIYGTYILPIIEKLELETSLCDISNKNRTYSLGLFREAKSIYKANKSKKPRITQAEALILANNKLALLLSEWVNYSKILQTKYI